MSKHTYLTKEELYKQHEHLVSTTLYRMLGQPYKVALSKNMEFDDLLQAGRMGLWRACIEFKKGHSSFQTYAINHIRWSVKNSLNFGGIIKYNHNNMPNKEDIYNVISFNQPMYKSEDGNDITFEETVAAEDATEFYDKVYFQELIEKLHGILNKREKKIVTLKLEGKNNTEIANKLNVSPSLITYYLHNIRSKFDNIRSDNYECG